MRKILVAYDGSAGADLAIRDMTHGGFGSRAEAKILALADVWLPQDNLTPEQLAEHPSFAAAHQRATEAIHSTRNIAVEGARLLHEMFPAWNISSEARAESPAWGILGSARDWQADLIVIGSHGRSLLQKMFLGSVSTKVAAEAHCSVRVVRPLRGAGTSTRQILVAMDGSKDSQLAINEALTREWPNNTVVHLVTVVDDQLTTSFLKDLAAGKAEGSLEAKLQDIMTEARGKFAAKGITAEMHVLEGDPKSKILSLSRDMNVDTIFMGARGMDHKNRLYLGTLASAICSRADCTVEIVREAADA
ncbi:MAG: universal stress protein [Verrucomicrobiales bacterium]